MKNVQRLSYDLLHKHAVTIAKNVRELEVDCIVGVSRGGLIPAVIVSHQLDLPLIPISYSSKAGAGDNKNHDNVLPSIPHKTICIIDDICDTSKTLKELVAHYQSQGKIVYTAVIHYKVRSDSSCLVPDLYGIKVKPDQHLWIEYPFEKRNEL